MLKRAQIYFALIFFVSVQMEFQKPIDAADNRKLRILVPVKPGYKELVNVERDPQTNQTTVTGICIDVFQAAIRGLEHKVEYEFIPFADATGQSAGTYNDLIHQVYLQRYDGAVGDITITAERSLDVDFTIPFSKMGTVAVVRTDSDRNMWIFLKPLDSKLWMSSAGFFVLLGFVVWVIEHPINEEFQGSVLQQIGTAFHFSFSTIVYAHREKLRSNLSKVVVVIWLFVVLILTSNYTATLSSMLTVQQIEQVGRKDARIGFRTGSFIGRKYINMNFTELKPYRSSEEYEEALTRGSKNGGVDAIIDEELYIDLFIAQHPTHYKVVSSEYNTYVSSNGFGFVFQKGEPLVRELSVQIMKLREKGTLEMIENKWFRTFDSSPDNNSYNILSFDNFRGLFLVSGTTSIFALLLHLIHKRKQRAKQLSSIKSMNHQTIDFEKVHSPKLDSPV